jgi:hypothetical protein
MGELCPLEPLRSRTRNHQGHQQAAGLGEAAGHRSQVIFQNGPDDDGLGVGTKRYDT